MAEKKREANQVIEFIMHESDPHSNVLVKQFEKNGSHIALGAKLLVQPNQVAILVKKGLQKQVFIADALNEGTHVLTASNTPQLSAIKSIELVSTTRLNADVYFFDTKTHVFDDWGTFLFQYALDRYAGIVSVSLSGYFEVRISNPQLLLNAMLSEKPKYIEVPGINFNNGEIMPKLLTLGDVNIELIGIELRTKFEFENSSFDAKDLGYDEQRISEYLQHYIQPLFASALMFISI